jgi:hypothetical protein
VSPQAASAVTGLVLLAAALAFDVYCVRDLNRADVVLVFPPRVWLYVIVLFTPFGGVAYLMLGRRR